MQGIIVVNTEGIPIKSTMDHPTTTQYASLMHSFILKARSTMREIDPQNDLTFLQICSKKNEMMVAPDKDYFPINVNVDHVSRMARDSHLGAHSDQSSDHVWSGGSSSPTKGTPVLCRPSPELQEGPLASLPGFGASTQLPSDLQFPFLPLEKAFFN
ncbi:hypothetical protein P7K49_031789 [Saguinus oedipus]|uniref:Roadblock/LAMTOR2 domain-containing protein n=1 Tax=Saguinus oedipus TaxID=9490 RepID=A0ABQ9U2B1_SAGOE|nr:hypothetical protein P7K49_031789 [Saguinus oedipus]